MPIRLLMVVDDDEDDQFLVAHVARRYDPAIEVASAFDGGEALERLRMLTPDAIILDINMPGMNGFDFLDAYASVFRDHCPVVAMLTNSAHDRDRLKAQSYSFVKGFFRKPLKFEDMADLARIVG